MEGYRAYGDAGTTDREVAAVRAIYDAFERRDVEAALVHVAPDVELLPPGTAAEVGRTEPYRGHDGVRQYFADAARVWDDLRLFATDVRAAGQSVVVFGHVEGLLCGEPVRRRTVWVWQVRDGLAAAMRVNDVGPVSRVSD
jgi:ketosteroid isomerase-like protein